MGYLILALSILCLWFGFWNLAGGIEKWYFKGKYKLVGFDLYYHDGEEWQRVDAD